MSSRRMTRLGKKATAKREAGAAPDRDSWCTPKWLADALGPFDLDPCSNPRSHVQADRKLMLEHGDDGLLHVESDEASTRALKRPYAEVRAFINPPYSSGQVMRWAQAYAHTRFCFLVRLDPSTAWFRFLYQRSGIVCVPRKRVNFEAPPGVKAFSNVFPHVLLFARLEDASDQIKRLSFAWRPR